MVGVNDLENPEKLSYTGREFKLNITLASLLARGRDYNYLVT